MSIDYRPYLVANQRQGIDLSMDPWLIPNDAYQQIYDAYQFLGVINKRNGYSWFESVPHAINDNGNPYQNILNIVSGVSTTTITLKNAHGLTTGDIVRFTNVEGLTTVTAPINGTRWPVTVTGATTFTIPATFGGAYTANTGTASRMPFPGTTYTGTPITAIATWIDDTNNQVLMVLDEKRAAIFDNSATNQCLVPIGNADQFTAPSPFLFWWENYLGKIYFTNNYDNIFYWDSSIALSAGLSNLVPHTSSADDATDAVNTCLMIKAFGSRLLLFNTDEGNAGTTRKPIRVRWCRAFADPTTAVSAGPPYNNVWDSVVPGQGGGFSDLTDSTYIISLGQIQTNILLGSQNDQFAKWYEIRQVNDPEQPFTFVPITVSRSINSTFGTIVLDRLITSLGNSGFVTVDGNTAGRYDQKIPQFVEDNIQQNAFDRCFGVRFDAAWQTWLLYPDNGANQNQILVYNYLDQSWAIYRPSLLYGTNLTCLGLALYPLTDPTWESYGEILPDLEWQDFGEATWISNPQNQTTMLLSGDALGNVWWMNQGGGDAADNVVYGQPENVGFAIEMQLTTRQWFPFANEAYSAQFGYIDFLVDGDPTTLIQVTFQNDNYTNNYLTSFFTCVPFEDIEYSAISNITQANPAQVTAIQHGLVTGQLVYIYSVQGMVEVNDASYTVTVINPDVFTLDGVDSTSFGAYTGGGIVAQSALLEATFWTRLWSGQTGVFHQLTLTTLGVDETFRLHACIPHFKPSGGRIYKG